MYPSYNTNPTLIHITNIDASAESTLILVVVLCLLAIAYLVAETLLRNGRFSICELLFVKKFNSINKSIINRCKNYIMCSILLWFSINSNLFSINSSLFSINSRLFSINSIFQWGIWHIIFINTWSSGYIFSLMQSGSINIRFIFAGILIGISTLIFVFSIHGQAGGGV